MPSPILPVYQNNDSPSPSPTLSLKHHLWQDRFFQRHTHIIQTHVLTHAVFLFRLPVSLLLSLSPHLPYLLAFPPAADALRVSTKQFWGGTSVALRTSSGTILNKEMTKWNRQNSITIPLTKVLPHPTHPFQPVLSSAVLCLSLAV